MKNIIAFALVAATLLALAASSCSGAGTPAAERLELAEQAFAGGSYRSAQAIADSLLLDSPSDGLSVEQLCRLSVLFMQLSDVSAEQELNTAAAALALAEAYKRDPDSTEAVIAASPVDIQAAMTLLTAINGASHGIIIDGDTIYVASDSIPDFPDEHHNHD